MSFVSRLEINENVDALVIYDHYYSGGADYKGEIKQVWGEEAMTNAIRMWFASFSGEIIRQPQRGGLIRDILTKPMGEVEAEDIEMAIRDGFEQDFVPYMVIIEDSLSVTPDYQNGKWIIYMKIYSPDFKIVTEVSEEIKARV